MNARYPLFCLIAVSLSCLISSCGSSTKVTSNSQSSVGQQLTDLATAYQQGIISEKEYNKLRKAIIKDND